MAHRAFVRIVALALTSVSVSGCVADFFAPLAVVVHRFPELRLDRPDLAQPQPDLRASADVPDDQPAVRRQRVKRHVARRVSPQENSGSSQDSLEAVRQSQADIKAADALRSRLAQDPGRLTQSTALIAERPSSGKPLNLGPTVTGTP